MKLLDDKTNYMYLFFGEFIHASFMLLLIHNMLICINVAGETKSHFGSLCTTFKARWGSGGFYALHCLEMHNTIRQFVHWYVRTSFI